MSESPVPAGAARPGRLALLLGPALALLVALLPLPLPPEARQVAALATLMVVWWFTEAVPMAVTALLPLLALPLMGVRPLAAAAQPYADPLIFLFLGGFLLALGMERWNLHRRMALTLLWLVGTRPLALLAGFMAATAFISAFVSNTATTVMMLPIALSVIGILSGDPAAPPALARHFPVALLLGVAWSASIGGLATLIGTPPNAILAGYAARTLGQPIGFGQWMLLGVPLAALMLPAAWALLGLVLFPLGRQPLPGAGAEIRRQLLALGRLTREEALILLVFSVTAGAWIFRPALSGLLPGLSDTGIALFGAFALFLLPARDGGRLLDWAATTRLPWGVLLLFGGGLSLAGAMDDSGLAQALGGAIGQAAHLPPLAFLLLVTGLVVFLTEVSSNTATATIFVPVMAALAAGLGAAPLYLCLPAALAASCAFMLPVATPPNAIIFASGQLSVRQMARAGFWLNIISIAIISLLVQALAPVIFGF